MEQTSTATGLPRGALDMTTRTTFVFVQQLIGEGIAPDGVATVRAKFEAVKMNMSSAMMSVSYDSASPSANPRAAGLDKTFGAMIGETITLAIAPNGAVRSMEKTPRLVEKVQSAPQTGAAMGVLGGGPEAMLSNDSMNAAYEGFANLPDKPVKAGDVWKSERTMATPMGVQTIASTFTMKGLARHDGHEVVRIGVAQTIRTAPGGATGVPMDMQMADATSQGEILFNAGLGRLERSTVDQTQPMMANMSMPDGSSRRVQASAKTKTTIELMVK